jgi:hypothetical protein
MVHIPKKNAGIPQANVTATKKISPSSTLKTSSLGHDSKDGLWGVSWMYCQKRPLIHCLWEQIKMLLQAWQKNISPNLVQ